MPLIKLVSDDPTLIAVFEQPEAGARLRLRYLLSAGDRKFFVSAYRIVDSSENANLLRLAKDHLEAIRVWHELEAEMFSRLRYSFKVSDYLPGQEIRCDFSEFERIELRKLQLAYGEVLGLEVSLARMVLASDPEFFRFSPLEDQSDAQKYIFREGRIWSSPSALTEDEWIALIAKNFSNCLPRPVQVKGNCEYTSPKQNQTNSPVSRIIGQTALKRRFAERLEVARSKGWPFPHTLIVGNEGMGRRTIAKALAMEISGAATAVHEVVPKSFADLKGALTNVTKNGGVVVPNLDALPFSIEPLVPILDLGTLDFLIGAGPSARVHSMSIPNFSLIATCRNASRVPRPLLAALSVEELDPYSGQELAAISSTQAVALGFGLEEGAAICTVGCAEATSGSVAALLKRVKRYAGTSTLSEAGLLSILKMLGISGKATKTGAGLLDDLNSMSGVEFEQWTAGLFARHGYRVKPTRVVGDHGIDLEMERAGKRVVVQCKRWSGSVGEPVIREFYGALLHAGADTGIFITTASFTLQAREFAQQKPLTLLDLNSLLHLFIHGGAIEAEP